MAASGGLFAGCTFLLPTRNDTRWSPDDHDRLYGLIKEHRGNVSTQFPTHILVIIDISSCSTWFRRRLQAGLWKGVPVLEVGWPWACWRAARVLGQEEDWGGYRLDPDQSVFIKAPLAPRRMRDNDQRLPSPPPRNREEGRSAGADCWRPPSDCDSPMSRLSTSMSDDIRPWANRDGPPRSGAASPVRPIRSKERPDDHRASPRPAFLRRSPSPHRWVERDVPPRPLPSHLPSRPVPNRTASAPTSTSTSPLSAQSPKAPLVRHKLPISVYDPERDPRRRASASNALRISITSTSLPPSSAHAPHPTPPIVAASTVACPLMTESPSTSTGDCPEKTLTPTSTLTPLTTISTLSTPHTPAPSEAGSSASKSFQEVRSKAGSTESAQIFIDTNCNPLWFAVHGTVEDQQDLIHSINQGGGLVLAENKHSRVRYHVFKTDETCVIPPDAVESLAALRQIKGTRGLTVSSCWIDRCLQSGRLINPESYVLQYSPTSYPVPQVCVSRKRKAETEILASRGDSGCGDASPDRSAEALLNVLDMNGITEVQDEPQPVLEQEQEQEQGPILRFEELDDYEYDEALLDALNSDSEEETDDDGICVIPEEEYQQSALARYAREIAELGGAVRTA